FNSRHEWRQQVRQGDPPADEILGHLRQGGELAPAAPQKYPADRDAGEQGSQPAQMPGDLPGPIDQPLNECLHGCSCLELGNSWASGPGGLARYCRSRRGACVYSSVFRYSSSVEPFVAWILGRLDL